MRKIFRSVFWVISFLVTAITGFFFLYANSLRGVNATTLMYYKQLKTELVKKGFEANTLVISGKRAEWHNQLLTSFGAARKSQHLEGNAIDIVVLDINGDGEINDSDVDIVTEIMEVLIEGKGGIGTYKTEKLIWNRQMVHFDSRGYKARWKR